jgi:hypothetical protein
MVIDVCHSSGFTRRVSTLRIRFSFSGRVFLLLAWGGHAAWRLAARIEHLEADLQREQAGGRAHSPARRRVAGIPAAQRRCLTTGGATGAGSASPSPSLNPRSTRSSKSAYKSTPMRWGPQIAHLLLQVQVQVIDGRLRCLASRIPGERVSLGPGSLTPPNRTLSSLFAPNHKDPSTTRSCADSRRRADRYYGISVCCSALK